MNKVDLNALRAQYHKFSKDEYEALLREIVREIKGALESSGLKFQVHYRVKNIDGFLAKLGINERGETKLECIEDMLGIRVVCPFLEDLANVERVLSLHFDITEVDKKHQRHSFREFGYDSTHLRLNLYERTIVHPLPFVAPVCEIQVRTILQDAWAEVEHELIYKSDWPIPTFQIKRKLAALNANLTLSDIIFQELREFQRDMLRKQEKRRSLVDGALRPLTEGTVQLGFEVKGDALPHQELEKIIIEALTVHSEGDFDEAIKLYSNALKMPGVETVQSILLNHRGMARLSLGNSDEAHKDFAEAVQIDESNYRAWYNLGIVLYTEQKLTSAQKAFETCLALNPAFNDARVKHILLLLEIGAVDAAVISMRHLDSQSVDPDSLSMIEERLADLKSDKSIPP